MAALTTAQEYEAVREAIQRLTASGNDAVMVAVGDMTLQYSQSRLPQLMARERELAARLTQRNIRKRTVPDFT